MVGTLSDDAMGKNFEGKNFAGRGHFVCNVSKDCLRKLVLMCKISWNFRAMKNGRFMLMIRVRSSLVNRIFLFLS